MSERWGIGGFGILVPMLGIGACAIFFGYLGIKSIPSPALQDSNNNPPGWSNPLPTIEATPFRVFEASPTPTPRCVSIPLGASESEIELAVGSLGNTPALDDTNVQVTRTQPDGTVKVIYDMSDWAVAHGGIQLIQNVTPATVCEKPIHTHNNRIPQLVSRNRGFTPRQDQSIAAPRAYKGFGRPRS